MILAGAQLRFLIVDDDKVSCGATASIIERLGHLADQADGVEAIEALAFERYDYVVVDVTVPRRSGEDVLSWLRAHPEWAGGMKVVVVSGSIVRNASRRTETVASHVAIPRPSSAQQWRGLVGVSLVQAAV